MKKFLLTLGTTFLALSANAQGVPSDATILIQGNTADGTKIVKWSNTLENGTKDDVSCIVYTNETAGNSWTNQLAFDYNYVEGQTYYLTFKVMGTPSDTQINGWFQNASNGTLSYNFYGFKVTSETEWTTVTMQGSWTEDDLQDNGPATRIVLNLGEYVGTMYMTDFTLYTIEDNKDDAIPSDATILIQGNTADGTKIVKWSNTLENGTKDDVSCIVYTNETAGNSWTNQLAFDYNYVEGQTYYLTFKVMGTPSDTQINGWFQNASNGTLSYNFYGFKVTSETEWTTVTMQGSWTEDDLQDNGPATRIVLNLGEYVGTMYMTDFTLYTLTDEADNDQPEVEVPEAVVAPSSTKGWFDAFFVYWGEETEPDQLQIFDDSLISVTKGENNEELNFIATLTEYQETEDSPNYEDAKLVITLEDLQFDTDVEYSVTIQPGAIKVLVDEVWVANELVEYSFTLEADNQEVIIPEPSIYPANNSSLSIIEDITISWEGCGVVAVDNYDGDAITISFTTVDGEGEVTGSYSFEGENPNGDLVGGASVVISFDQELVEKGTYTVTIPAGMFIVSNLDGVNFTNEAISLVYNIDGTSAINSFFNFDNNETIYNLQGVKVNKNNLGKGIYIVNGKKVVIR